jgi:hypothetical protein
MSTKASPTDRTPLLSSRQTVEASYDGHHPSTRHDSVDDVIDTKQQEEEPKFNIPGITQRDFVLILTGLWSATFLGSLDGTIVATLLTDIGTSFEKSNMASWLGTSYLLSVCCFTPIYGRLCDIIGRRGAIMTALTFFGIGTIGCGIAPSMETLILARAVAGAGGGAMMSVGSIIVTDLGKFRSGCRFFFGFFDFLPLQSHCKHPIDTAWLRPSYYAMLCSRRRALFQGYANVCFGIGSGLGGPIGESRLERVEESNGTPNPPKTYFSLQADL